MAFDVDAVLAAHRAWSFTLGAQTFLARHVSAMTVVEYDHRATEATALLKKYPRRGSRAQVMALRWLLRRAFPWRPSYLLRGDPVNLILRLPPAARTETLTDFFACLQGMTPTTDPATLPLRKIPGTPSPAPIRRRNL